MKVKILSSVLQRLIYPELSSLWLGYRLAPAVGVKVVGLIVGFFEGPVDRKVGANFIVYCIFFLCIICNYTWKWVL